jgi:hypothetical protein
MAMIFGQNNWFITDVPKDWMKKAYIKKWCIGWLLEGKEADQKQDGKKAYSERWKNVVYEMETGGTDFVADSVPKDVAIRHRTTTYVRKYIHTCMHTYIRTHTHTHT